MKRTPRWRVRWRGHITTEDYPVRFPLWVRHRYRGQQRLGIGVLWGPIDILGTGFLDEPSQVHDGNRVADVLNHSKIMGNKQECNPEIPLQVCNKIQHL